MKRALVAWSSGKDSAFALAALAADAEVEIAGLLTTVNVTHDRVAMHAVRRRVLEAQAAAVGLPLTVVELPWPCDNATYEARMRAACAAARDAGVSHVAFGDLYLEDVRAYRERHLAEAGLAPLFPLWGRDTRALAHEMIERGLDAVLTCVDPRRVPAALAGRPFDAELLGALPPGADPCGENGEFHTCVRWAPGFGRRLRARPGAIVAREGFVFADLVLDP